MHTYGSKYGHVVPTPIAKGTTIIHFYDLETLLYTTKSSNTTFFLGDK